MNGSGKDWFRSLVCLVWEKRTINLFRLEETDSIKQEVFGIFFCILLRTWYQLAINQMSFPFIRKTTRSMLPAGLPRAKHQSTLVKFVLSDGWRRKYNPSSCMDA
jgi:hypothetical protein